MTELLTSGPVLGVAATAAVATAVGARAMFSPRSALLGPVVFRGPSSNPPRVVLTFDDGPDPRTTPRLLDVLRERGVPATFFLIGIHARRHPDLVRRINAEGHLIGNHSLHHHDLGMFRRRRYWERELEETDRVILDAIGRRPLLFRPPVGMRNVQLARALRRGGYRVVTWTRSARDGVRPSPARFERLGATCRAGDILALHDGCDRGTRPAKERTVASVGPLLDQIAARGLGVACLSDFIDGPCYR